MCSKQHCKLHQNRALIYKLHVEMFMKMYVWFHISFFSGTGLYAIVFRTANFKQDVTRNKDDASTVCTAFHIKSKLLFSRQLFLDWHMCQNSCSNLSDQVEAYCTVKRSSLLISLGPFPSVHALKLDWHPNCSDTQSNLDDIH